MIAHQSISIVGAGAWGTALANAAARAGRDVVLYARDSAVAVTISQTRENPKLPGIQLAKTIAVTSDLAEAAKAGAVLLVTPAQSLRQAATALAPHLASNTPVIVCAKGIERGTHRFMTQIVAEVAPRAV
ncbi:MAG TPA: glycerol-3-phosphate dehydrogenase, partial [Afipia sp.]|nr:glycerol-3-phosphate dehydrogenase [Afipia sp.]